MTQASGGAARHYAEAAIDVATKHHAVRDWQQALAQMETIFTDAEVAEAFANPRLDDGQRTGLALSLVGEDLSPELRNFVKLLVLARRTAVVAEIRQEFDTLVDEAEGRIELDVTVPMKLAAGDENRITEELSAKVGRDVKVNLFVDADIIGGLIIRRGDHVVDGSVRRRLAEMREELLAG